MDRRAFFFTVLAAAALFCRRLFIRDDTAYLQEVIDSQDGHHRVRFPSGTFNVFSPLVVNARGRHIDGCGARLTWRGNHTDSGMLVLRETVNTTVSNFCLYGGPSASLRLGRIA